MLVDFSITREIEGDDLESVIEGELRLQVQRVPRRLIETTGEGPIRRITVREELGGNKDVAVDPFITSGYQREGEDIHSIRKRVGEGEVVLSRVVRRSGVFIDELFATIVVAIGVAIKVALCNTIDGAVHVYS